MKFILVISQTVKNSIKVIIKINQIRMLHHFQKDESAGGGKLLGWVALCYNYQKRKQQQR